MALNTEAIAYQRYIDGDRNFTYSEIETFENIKSGKLKRSPEIYKIDLPFSTPLTVEQIEAYLFVSNIHLDKLYEHTLGSSVDALRNASNVARLLPTTPGIYFICAYGLSDCPEDFEMGYIGMTEVGFDKRISSFHHGVKSVCRRYTQNIITLKYLPMYKDMDVRSVESAAISYFNPTVNDIRPYPNREVFENYIQEVKQLFQDYSI